MKHKTRLVFLTLGSMFVAGTTWCEHKLVAQTGAAVEEKLFSGPQVGESVQPFKVRYFKDDEPKEIEIVGKDTEKTNLVCFIHRLSTDDRILYGLGLVDFYVRRHDNLESHFVLLSDERNKIETMLRGWARNSVFTQSLVSLSVDGLEGPGFYGLNRNTAMTVLVIQEGKVVSNLVFNAPNNFDLEKIMVAVADALDVPTPKLKDIQQELREHRQRELDKRIKASPVFKLAPNEELGRHMYWLVNARGNMQRNSNRRKQMLLEWVGDDNSRGKELRDFCKSIITNNEIKLNQYSRGVVEEFAEH